MRSTGRWVALAAILALAGTAPPLAAQDAPANTPADNPAKSYPGLDAFLNPDPFPSTYTPLPSQTTAIVGATVLLGTGADEITGATVVMKDGKILSAGRDVAIPQGARVVDGKGKWVTPGLIDVHSHLGVYPSPGVPAHSDGNEITSPNTAGVWAEHSIWPQDPGFARALAGGITTLKVLPGSANLFGGRTVTLKNVMGRTYQDMKFPDAPHGLKMACGENPKRVYGTRNQTPGTRMGNVFGYRRAWIEAQDYRKKWDDYRVQLAKWEANPKDDKGEDKKKPDAPKRDLILETLAGVLAGEILVQNHCYRADEMAIMLDIANEFGFKIAMFHHASEAYKIADKLAKAGTCFATWADWWGFKLESYDGIEENAALSHVNGACTVIHSDNETIIQRMNQEAAHAMAAGRRLGLDITRGQAITWITGNAAKAIGVGDKTGTLEPGKMADVVLWSADPFSVYAKPELVFIDGGVAYDRNDPSRQPQSDFELGQPGKPRPGETTVR